MVAMATNSGEENRGKEDKKNKRIHPTMRAKKQSFRKRKDCVLQKSMELSDLCDIKVCAIFLDANGKVETWPDEVQCGQEATSEVADHHQIILHPQHEWEDTESWIERLLGPSENGFLTDINDPMNDDMPACCPVSGFGKDGKEANSEVAGHQLISHSQHEPEEIDSSIEGSSADEFLSDINDPMNDNMPAALVARDDDQAMEPRIMDDQINPWYSFDDQQNIDEWLNALVNWNSFEQNALVLDLSFGGSFTLDTGFLV